MVRPIWRAISGRRRGPNRTRITMKMKNSSPNPIESVKNASGKIIASSK